MSIATAPFNFGRTPGKPEEDDRYTLDELISDICSQTGIGEEGFVPSRCDHPLCGFHSSFVRMPDGSLFQVSDGTRSTCEPTPASQNRDYIGRSWKRNGSGTLGTDGVRDSQELKILPKGEPVDFDTFVECMRSNRFTLTSMAFHDRENINIERLIRCSLHVYENGRLIPFCLKYILDE